MSAHMHEEQIRPLNRGDLLNGNANEEIGMCEAQICLFGWPERI